MAGEKKKVSRAVGLRRKIARCHASKLIARQWSDAQIERYLVNKFNIKRAAAKAIRLEAWREILDVAESNRPERFRSTLAAMRHLYAQAFEEKKYTVCANLLSQMREMFGLNVPFAEGGSSSNSTTGLGGRTNDELQYFAEFGMWPEEAKKAEQLKAVVADNPLDELV